MIKSIFCAILLASCVSKPVLRHDTQREKDCLQYYRDGAITWAEYKTCLKSERTP